MSTNFSTGTSDSSTSASTSAQGMYEEAQSSMEQAGSSLREELSNLKSDLDSLMSRASTLTDHELREARDRMMVKFGSMRHAAKGVAKQASRQLNHGVDVTSDYVKDRPLQAVAIATGVGLLLGAVLRRH